MNVILVEDSPLLRKHLLRLLQDIEGVHVIAEAASQEEAIGAITRHAPDLVLLDLSLASGHGFKVLERIRAAGFQRPVFVMTGSPSAQLARRATELTADGFFDKSRVDELMAQVHALKVKLGPGIWPRARR